MKKTKENSGIPLVALIVIIIVLLILAAVSLKLIGGVNINKPTTWEVGHEYNFGNGIYEQRFTGKIDAGANVVVNTELRYGSTAISNISTIVSEGGYWVYGDGYRFAWLGDTIPGSVEAGIRTAFGAGNELYLYTKSVVVRDNAPYDIWVLYTKK